MQPVCVCLFIRACVGFFYDKLYRDLEGMCVKCIVCLSCDYFHSEFQQYRLSEDNVLLDAIVCSVYKIVNHVITICYAECLSSHRINFMYLGH